MDTTVDNDITRRKFWRGIKVVFVGAARNPKKCKIIIVHTSLLECLQSSGRTAMKIMAVVSN